MKESIESNLRKYIFWGIILLLIIASYFIVKPYLIALITSFILAFLVKPFHTLLSKKLNKHLSAIITVLLIVAIVILPLATITTGVIQQAYSSLNDESLKASLENLSDKSFFESINLDIDNLRSKITTALIDLITSSISYIPSLALSLIIIVVSTYYILINWKNLSLRLEEFVPFTNKTKVVKDIAESTKGIVYGTILIAIIEAIVSSIGFALLGVPNSLFMAALIFFFGFIPGIGPAFVWVPIAIYYTIMKYYPQAIGVIILGVIISVLIDNILKTKILGEKSNIHPLIMLVGILGGISLFGIFGFIIGPLILIYTIKLISESVHQKNK